jgi:predicted RNA methylase
MRAPRPGFERAIVGLYRALAEYAEAHAAGGSPVGADYFIGDEGWSEICRGALTLLNGELGRLDGGTLDAAFRRLLESRGSTEAIAEVRSATAAVAPLPRGKSRPAESPIGSRRLTDREREIVSLLKVESNVAIYQPEETIPDWSLLKDVMRALGGSWKTGGKKAKGGFRFADDVDAAEIVRLAVSSGEILDARAAEFFETSDALADELVAYLNVEAFGRYLEPSAGKGAIAQAILRVSPGANVSCVEAFPPHRKALEEQGLELIGEDFLRLSPDDITHFDGIAMNPPFGKQADIHHILWASKFLKTGGRLAAIASAGVAYRNDRASREFRSWVESNGGSMTENPDGSFAHAGTGVRTVMVKVTIGAAT